jgi:glycine cleavage system pyridoxal-binding protein P
MYVIRKIRNGRGFRTIVKGHLIQFDAKGEATVTADDIAQVFHRIGLESGEYQVIKKVPQTIQQPKSQPEPEPEPIEEKPKKRRTRKKKAE